MYMNTRTYILREHIIIAFSLLNADLASFRTRRRSHDGVVAPVSVPSLVNPANPLIRRFRRHSVLVPGASII